MLITCLKVYTKQMVFHSQFDVFYRGECFNKVGIFLSQNVVGCVGIVFDIGIIVNFVNNPEKRSLPVRDRVYCLEKIRTVYNNNKNVLFPEVKLGLESSLFHLTSVKMICKIITLIYDKF
jgi:hypothetical protein